MESVIRLTVDSRNCLYLAHKQWSWVFWAVLWFQHWQGLLLVEVFISCSSIVKFSYFLYPYLSHNLCIRDALSLVVTTPHDTDHWSPRHQIYLYLYISISRVIVCINNIVSLRVRCARAHGWTPTAGRGGARSGVYCTACTDRHCTHCTHGHQVDTMIAPIHIHNWQCSMCLSSSSHCYKSFVSFNRLTLICGHLLLLIP